MVRAWSSAEVERTISEMAPAERRVITPSEVAEIEEAARVRFMESIGRVIGEAVERSDVISDDAQGLVAAYMAVARLTAEVRDDEDEGAG